MQQQSWGFMFAKIITWAPGQQAATAAAHASCALCTVMTLTCTGHAPSCQDAAAAVQQDPLPAGVQVIAATNRPGAIDAALLRPGRLEMLLFVPPPDAAGRLQVLEIHTRSMPLAPDVDLQASPAHSSMHLRARH